MKELILRWRAKTPWFFQKLIKIGLLLFGVGSGLLTAEYVHHFPEWVSKIACNMVLIGTVISLVAKFAVEDKRDII